MAANPMMLLESSKWLMMLEESTRQSAGTRGEKVVCLWLKCGPRPGREHLGARAGGLLLTLLIILSGVMGFVLARTFRAYALIPATMLILLAAWYLGIEQGFATGATAFVASVVVMQLIYFPSMLTYLLIQNLSVLDQVQSEASPPTAESRAAL